MLIKRAAKLREVLFQKKLDAFFVSDYYNVFYLTGFKTLSSDERAAFSLITPKNIYLFTDRRYYNENSKLKCQNSNLRFRIIEPAKNLVFHLQEIIETENLNTMGFEADDLRFIEYQGITSNLKTSLIPAEKIIIKQREIKDYSEIEKIKKACEIGDLCLKEVMPTIKLETSEKEIAFRLESYLKKKNLNTAFKPIVAIDANSATPHYDTEAGEGKVAVGSIILIDFGVKHEQYLSDISRTIFFGKPSTEIINIYNKLLESQGLTIKKIKNTKDPKEIDQFCRESIMKNRLPNYPHSTGHGVGLEIHEYPKISQTSFDTILANQIFTIEPGVYFEGKFGIRIEDTIWVKSKDDVEIFTQFSKQPFIFS